MQNTNQKLKKIKLSALLFVSCLFPSLGFGNPTVLQEIAEIESVIERIKSEELNASNRILSLEQERPIISQEINNLKAQLSQLERRMKSYEIDLADLEVNASDVNKQNIKTQAELRRTQAEKATLVTDVAKLVTTIQQTNSQISSLASKLQSLDANYVKSTSTSQQQLTSLLVLKGRFEQLVSLWEKRVGEIIAYYEQRKSSSTTDAQKDLINRYISVLNNLLNRYRSVFGF